MTKLSLIMTYATLTASRKSVYIDILKSVKSSFLRIFFLNLTNLIIDPLMYKAICMGGSKDAILTDQAMYMYVKVLSIIY